MFLFREECSTIFWAHLRCCVTSLRMEQDTKVTLPGSGPKPDSLHALSPDHASAPSTSVYFELGPCHSWVFFWFVLFSKAGVPAPTSTPTHTEINLSVTPVFVRCDGKTSWAAKTGLSATACSSDSQGCCQKSPLATLQHTAATSESIKLYLITWQIENWCRRIALKHKGSYSVLFLFCVQALVFKFPGKLWMQLSWVC